MSATIIASDLTDASFEVDYKGIRYSRKFLVQVDGGDAVSMLYQALTCPGIPQQYDFHPFLTNLIVTQVKGVPAGSSSPNQIWVTCLYEVEYDHSKSKPSRTSKCTIEFGTTMANVKCTRDTFGNDMILEFSDPNQGGDIRTQPAEFDIQVPMPLLTFRRREPLLGVDYVALKLAYEGHINSRTFYHGDARTWLMTQFEAQLQGDAYNVTYQFQFHGNIDPGTWDGIFFFKEPSGTRNLTQGAPAEDISIDNGGIELFQVYPSADFNQLVLF